MFVSLVATIPWKSCSDKRSQFYQSSTTSAILPCSASTIACRAPLPTSLRSFCGGVRGTTFCRKRLEPQPKFAVPWVGPLLYRWRGTVSPRTVSMFGCPTGGITKYDCRSCPKSSIIQVGWSLLTAFSSRKRKKSNVINKKCFPAFSFIPLCFPFFPFFRPLPPSHALIQPAGSRHQRVELRYVPGGSLPRRPFGTEGIG